jgi:hypothetical protein
VAKYGRLQKARVQSTHRPDPGDWGPRVQIARSDPDGLATTRDRNETARPEGYSNSVTAPYLAQRAARVHAPSVLGKANLYYQRTHTSKSEHTDCYTGRDERTIYATLEGSPTAVMRFLMAQSDDFTAPSFRLESSHILYKHIHMPRARAVRHSRSNLHSAPRMSPQEIVCSIPHWLWNHAPAYC